MGDAGARELFRMLREANNCQLDRLSLCFNSVSDGGGNQARVRADRQQEPEARRPGTQRDHKQRDEGPAEGSEHQRHARGARAGEE